MSESDLSLKSLDYEVISNSCKEKYGVLWGQLFSRHIGFPSAEILILPLFVEERCLSFQPNFRWCYRLGIQIAISQIKFWPRPRHFNLLLHCWGNPKSAAFSQILIRWCSWHKGDRWLIHAVASMAKWLTADQSSIPSLTVFKNRPKKVFVNRMAWQMHLHLPFKRFIWVTPSFEWRLTFYFIFVALTAAF